MVDSWMSELARPNNNNLLGSNPVKRWRLQRRNPHTDLYNHISNGQTGKAMEEHLSFHIKFNFFKSLVVSTILYGRETWIPLVETGKMVPGFQKRMLERSSTASLTGKAKPMNMHGALLKVL